MFSKVHLFDGELDMYAVASSLVGWFSTQSSWQSGLACLGCECDVLFASVPPVPFSFLLPLPIFPPALCTPPTSPTNSYSPFLTTPMPVSPSTSCFSYLATPPPHPSQSPLLPASHPLIPTYITNQCFWRIWWSVSLLTLVLHRCGGDKSLFVVRMSQGCLCLPLSVAWRVQVPAQNLPVSHASPA